MARPMDAVLERELSYVTHSGFGHQYESLMRGLFLAAATNRTLIVPPFMGHKNNLDINGAVGCVGSRQIWEYHVKEDLLNRSKAALSTNCTQGGDSFFQLFDFEGLPARDGGCGTVQSRTSVSLPCPAVVHDSLTVYGSGTCTSPRPCEETIKRVTNGVISNPIFLSKLRKAKAISSVVSASEPFCLGPINDYFVHGLLQNCRQHHALADEYLRYGLPWNSKLVGALSELQPPVPPASCACYYVRLPDHNTPRVYSRHSGNVSSALLLSSLKQNAELLQDGLYTAHNESGFSSRALEVVSNCFPAHTCEQHLKQAHAVIQHSGRRERAGSVLGMTQGNAEIVYDMFRCARCASIKMLTHSHYNQGHSNHSSFFDAIRLLHARWHRTATGAR